MIFNVVWTCGSRVPHSTTAPSTTLEEGEYLQAFPFHASGGAFASEWLARLLVPAGPGRQRVDRDLLPAAQPRDRPRLPGARAAQQAPAHLPGPDQRRRQAAADALGPLLPMYSGTEKIDFEDPADDATFGRGRIEDFTWKGMLDMATCTECGRCQSQCPAWNTEQAA